MDDQFHTFVPYSENEFYKKLESLIPGITKGGTYTIINQFTNTQRQGSVDWKVLVPIILLQEHNACRRRLEHVQSILPVDKAQVDVLIKHTEDVWDLYLDWFELFCKYNQN